MVQESHQPQECGAARRWLDRIPSWLPMTIAWLPVIVWFVKRLDDGSDEPLGLLALATACVLAWRDRKTFSNSPATRITGALLIFSAVASIGVLPPMIRAGITILGIGVWHGIHRRPGLLGLFVLSLPVVASLQFYIGWPMRLVATEGAVRLLELGGIVVSRHGVNIDLGGSRIGVDPACSGILMLWHGLAAAMALAAIHRVSWKTAIVGGGMAILLVLPANTVRAAWLALEESGRVQPSGISHGNIGLICFLIVLVPLWWWNSKHARPRESELWSSPAGNTEKIILLLTAAMTPWLMFRGHPPENDTPLTPPPSTFSFNGVTNTLQALAPSPAEAAFSASFPGTLSSHSWGQDQVILRRVTKATRRLHPSHDCLRSAGFETTHSTTVRSSDGSEWSRFTATRGEERLIVHERIVSEQDGGTWTDVPMWYWSALAHPLNGPWRAETVISR